MRRLAETACALLVCALAGYWLLDLRRVDLAVPLWYDGDALYYGAVVKALVEHGWYLTNPRLGMPFGQELHDFPMPDTLSFVLLRGLAALARGDVQVMNLFYLASYPLTTCSTLCVLRALGVSFWPALLASQLYTFTPHHVVAGRHLMYTTYWTVPPVLYVLLRIGAGDLVLRGWRDLRTRGVAFSLLACAAIASTGGVYYPFFACVFLLVMGAYAAVRYGAAVRARLPLVLVAWTFTVFVLNLVPCIVHRMQHAPTATAQRAFVETEVFGLRLAQVLLPVAEHRCAPLAALRQSYTLDTWLNAHQPVALGLVASAGLMVLVGWLLFARQRRELSPAGQLLDGTSVLAAVALLLGLTGGFAGVFAFLVSPQLRNYANVIVYLALFACAAVALVVDRWRPAADSSRLRRTRFAAANIVLLVVGLLDCVPAPAWPDLGTTRSAHAADRRFFAAVEASVPRGAMVFQWPRQEFPEGESYEHLKGYLHTERLRWSFGAMRGRAADLWQRQVCALSPHAMVDSLAAAGFAGICFDRALGKEADHALQAAVADYAGGAGATSDDGRYVFVSLGARGAQIAAAPDGARQRERALYPVLVTWGPEFVGSPSPDGAHWRGCGREGRIVFDNLLPRARKVRLAMTVVGHTRGTLALVSEFMTADMAVTRHPTEWTREVELPPGRSSLRLRSDTRAEVFLPWLPPMAFGVGGLAVVDVDA
jgi:phosphoglycerol transferase